MIAGELKAIESGLTHARLSRLFADWITARGNREFPSRADFTPESLQYLLGNIILFDVQHDPLRLRYRLIGSNLVNRRGYDLTGRFLDQHPEPAFRDLALPAAERIVRQRVPQRLLVHMTASTNRIFHQEILALPLSSDGITIDRLLVGQLFSDDD